MKSESPEPARKRAPNFTRRETKVLVELVQTYASTIDSKKTDHSTIAEKNRAWVELSRDFNAKCGGDPYRTSTVLKHRYGNMRKQASRRLRIQQPQSNQLSSSNPCDNADIMENILQRIENYTDTEDFDMEDEEIITIHNDLDVKEILGNGKSNNQIHSDIEYYSDEDPLTLQTDNTSQIDVVRAEKADVGTPVLGRIIPDKLENIQKQCYLEKHHLELQHMREKHQMQLDMMSQEYKERMKMMKEEHDTKMKLLKTVGIVNQM